MTATETIHAALGEVVARRGRERLFERLRTEEGIDLADEAAMAPKRGGRGVEGWPNTWRTSRR